MSRARRAPEARPPRIEIRAKLDRHGAEALQLEVRRLAKRYGIQIVDVRVERSAWRSKVSG